MQTLTRRYPRLGLVLLAYIAFIALGMPDGLIGVAWPSIRQDFSIPLDALGALLFVSTAGYLASSFFSGRLISLLGIGRVLAISCALTGLALLGYTLVPAWGLMVALGALAGMGAGAIDAGLNTYVAAHFGEGLMQWLHASYGVGFTIGPFVMTLALNVFRSWRTGYIIVAAVQLILAACFTLFLSVWQHAGSQPAAGEPVRLTDYRTPISQTLLQARVWLSLLLFFLYTGAEVAIGAWAYTLLTEARRVRPETAGLLVGSYWAMFVVGRVAAGLITRRTGAGRLAWAGLVGALLCSVFLWWNPVPAASLLSLGLVCLFIAPIYPSLTSATSRRVGERFAANTIGMQVAAAGLGAAAIPSLVGILANTTSLEAIPISLVVLFILLLFLHGFSEVRTIVENH